MNNTIDFVKDFFKKFESSTNKSQIEIFRSLYGETFLFGGPQGVQAVNREDFLKILPKRKEFFNNVGLKSTKLISLKEEQLNNHYISVRTTWIMQFAKQGKIIDNQTITNYILYCNKDALYIVAQIDDQDLMARVQELGLFLADT